MAYAQHNSVMDEMNTTPLIDVLLVLLIMFIMTIPATMHSIDFDLSRQPTTKTLESDPVQNRIVITDQDIILWNGEKADLRSLAVTLKATAALRPEPEVQLQPAAGASYERSAQVLRLIKLSGVSNFGFVGNERYRQFGSVD